MMSLRAQSALGRPLHRAQCFLRLLSASPRSPGRQRERSPGSDRRRHRLEYQGGGVALATASERERFLRLRSSRRFRQRDTACVLQGSKLVLEAMRRDGSGVSGRSGTPVRRIFLNADLVDDYTRGRWEKRAAKLDVPVRTIVNAADMRKMTGMDRVDVVAECCAPPLVLLDDRSTWPAARPHSVLILDGVQDPGNVGTLIRTAYLLGWDMVGIGRGTVDPTNDKCLRAAAGAAWDVPLFCGEIGDLSAFLAQDGPVIYAAADQSAGSAGSYCPSATSQQLAGIRKAQGGVAFNGSRLQSNTGKDETAHLHGHHPTFCLVLGNEGNGLLSAIPDEVQDIGPVTIPTVSSNAGLDSLGVASAGAILMHMLGHDSAGGDE